MSWKEKREMRLRYNAEADGYDELYSDEQRTKYELAFRRIVFCGADRILDCGCGTGTFLEKMAGRVQFAVGVDLSPKMLERAKLRLGQISNVELVCADIDFLPFSEGTFRHVFMFTVLPSFTRLGLYHQRSAASTRNTRHHDSKRPKERNLKRKAAQKTKHERTRTSRTHRRRQDPRLHSDQQRSPQNH